MIYIDTTQNIDPISLIDKKGCGAIVSYHGYVRDNVNDKKVKKMICKENEQSEKIMKKIEMEIREKFPVNDVIIYHRIGELNPGDLMTVVLVSSIHRNEAFEACRFGIDRIKDLEPIERQDIFE